MAEQHFKPFLESRFPEGPQPQEQYPHARNTCGYAPLAPGRLDAVTADNIAGFVAKRPEAGCYG